MANNSVTIEAKLKENGVLSGARNIKTSLDDIKRADGSLDWSGIKSGKDAASQADSGFTVLKGTLANLASAGIMAAAGAVKDFCSDIVEVGAQFDTSMSKVSALSGATGDQLAALESKARELGATTTFSASEAADALGYMALAGWDTESMLSGVGPVLTLAQAGQMDLAAASDLVTDYLSAFNMTADETGRMVDVLAYAQGNANTTTEGLGQAFKNCAANCNAAGLDIETTTAAISMMANQGLKGSEAGTALTAVMRDMTAKMKNGAIEIGNATVAVVDANGNYRDFADILADVEAATDGMGDAEKAAALQSTFTADSIKGLNLMLNAGSDELVSFRDELYNSAGAGQEMADTMTDNLEGDLAGMNSALEALKLSIFDSLETPLRNVVQVITNNVLPTIQGFTEYLPGIVDSVIAFGTGIFDAISVPLGNVITFITENVVPGISASFEAIQPALDLVGTAFGTLASTIGDLVGGAVDAISGKFSSDLEGSMITFYELIQSTIIPGLEGFAAFIVDTVVPGVQTFADFVTTNVIPAISNFASFISANVIPALQQIGEFIISNVVPALQSFADFVTNTVVPTIGQIGEFITTSVIPALQGFADFVLSIVVPAVQSMAQWIADNALPVFNQIADFITGTLIPALQGMADYFTSTIVPALQTVADFITSNVIPVFGQVADFITTNIVPVLDIVVAAISTALETIATVWSGAWDGISTVLTSVWDAISSTVETVLGVIQGVIDAALGVINGNWDQVWNAIKGIADSIWNGIKSVIESAINAVKGVIDAVLGAISALWSSIWNAIKDTVETVWNGIKSAIETAINAAKDTIDTVVNTIKDTVGNVFDAVKGTVETVWNAIKGFIEDPINAAKDTVDTVVGTIQSTVGDVFNGIKGTVETVWNGIKSAIQTPIESARDLVSGAIDAIKGFFNFSISWPHIPLPHFGINPSGWQIGDLLQGVIPSLGIDWYAKGGVFNSAQIIGIGEAGPEAVVPLAGSRMKPFSEAVAADLNNIGGSMDPNALAAAIVKALKAAGVGQTIIKLDGKTLGEALAPYLDQINGSRYNNARRGLAQ